MHTKPAAALAAAAITLTACGASGTSTTKHTTLTVFAAASLTNTFTELGKAFEKDHPGVKVRFSFGGSSDLVSQIQQGAPADVFAAADEASAAGLSQAEDVKPFARNQLEIAVPPDNPAKIASLTDLSRNGVRTVVCAVPVPCGTATAKLEQQAGLTLKPVSEEQSVTDVLGKVETGEADAGIVYVTDVKGAGSKVVGISIPATANVVNTDVITVIGGTKQQHLSEQFVDFVLGSTGQAALAAAGFSKP